jgi:hypothetical protein
MKASTSSKLIFSSLISFLAAMILKSACFRILLCVCGDDDDQTRRPGEDMTVVSTVFLFFLFTSNSIS